MNDEEKAALGLQNAGRLGPTIADAREQFKKNVVIRELFGDDFVDRYCTVNKVDFCFLSYLLEVLTGLLGFRSIIHRRYGGGTHDQACRILLGKWRTRKRPFHQHAPLQGVFS